MTNWPRLAKRNLAMRGILRLTRLIASVAAVAAVTAGAAAAATAGSDSGDNWPAYGHDPEETHYSPLARINRRTVSKLGLAWSLDLAPAHVLSTPLAVDGVIYIAVGYSIVHAVDARSGKLLWQYDPKVTAVAGRKLRTGWGIRGLAYDKGRLFVGTHDGRLLALDAQHGRLLWSVATLPRDDGSFISGPPRVLKDKVIIGFGGSDFGPVRGYVTAYYTATGQQAWRFFIVPGDPAKGFEDEAMAMAAKTWHGEWWKLGGGGAVWNAMTYDPKYNRVYLGTGNGGPWNPRLRSPGGGDNLFLCSVVALDADTGKYLWHYQTTPGDAWDYNSSMDIELTTLRIAGRDRDVILHAPKNGFFYVIDRAAGKLISAEKFAKTTWAERVDMSTGRPVVANNARYETGGVLLWPSFQGAHNWFPMSYSARTRLAYIPTIAMPAQYSEVGVDKQNWHPIPLSTQFTGLATGDGDAPADAGTSTLLAWDPIRGKKAWEIPTPGPHNGGTLATAGDVLFQGLADGHFRAYDVNDGKLLWSFFAGTAVLGTPITFSVRGAQYIAVLAGPLHSAPGGFGSMAAQFGWNAREHPRRLLAFTLGGTAKLPYTPAPHRVEPLDAPDFRVDETRVQNGIAQWSRCVLCHGPGAVAGGTAPDLRASMVPLDRDGFAAVVRIGSLETRGMPKFAELSDAELESLRHYIRYRARVTTRATR
jgi:quinohemoprotein ethanol dehydrogenase